VTGELAAADMAFLMRQKKFGKKFSTALSFLSLSTNIKDPSVGIGAFSLNTMKMDLALS
jgi:hypothetical protein